MSGAATPKSGVVTPKSAALTPKTPTNPPSEVISKPRSGRGKAKSPHASHPTLTPPVLPARNIESVMEGAGVECVINVDDRPNIPLKARIVPSAGNSCAKWLNHKPLENFDEGKAPDLRILLIIETLCINECTYKDFQLLLYF